MHRRFHALTLTELLVALVLLSIIALGLANISFFSHFHVISSDRRAKLQNEASLALEHMTKEISKAIGNEVIDGADSVVATDDIASRTLMRIFIDASADGQAGDRTINNPDSDQDHWIAYRYEKTDNDKYQVLYCGRCRQANCNQCMDAEEILSKDITYFDSGKPAGTTLTNNFITVQISGRWNPDQAVSPDNPEVTMRASIKMSSVSTN